MELRDGHIHAAGLLDQIASQYVGEHGLDEQGAARVFALTGGAMMDAGIGNGRISVRGISATISIVVFP